MADHGEKVTVLLRQWRAGDHAAEEQLFRELMPELHRIAGYLCRGENPSHLMEPTALVNEAFLRLAAIKNIEWQNGGHFLAIATRVMRRLLVEEARSRHGVQFAPMEEVPEHILGQCTLLESVAALDIALDEMEKVSPEWCTVVRLKFFAGLTDAEAAENLGISLRSFQRDWHGARMWLLGKLADGDSPAGRNDDDA